MQKSQQLAARAVARVLAGHNLSQTLESLWRSHPGDTPQRRAATQDLSHGTLRHYGELQTVLDRLLKYPLEDEQVRCLLMVALYQLMYGRSAEYAVVNHAVQATAQLKKAWARGLVNAVLRNFLRQRAALAAPKPDDDIAYLAYPGWWVDKLRQQYPDRWQAILAAGNQHPPMTLRVNRRRTDPARYQTLLAAAGITAQVTGASALTLDHPLPVEKLPGFAEGLVSVQDCGAQLAAPLLDLHDGMRVLDACCAPGGKTGQLLEWADLELTAMDHDTTRLERTRSNLLRLGYHAELKTGDAAHPADWWDGQPFDRILADVPCSASGIVRRHIDIKWLRRETDLAHFATQQTAILHGLWSTLKIGGKLLYATCSVFIEENQRLIDAFLQQQADARQQPLPGLDRGQLLPCGEHDGFFYALLEKI